MKIHSRIRKLHFLFLIFFSFGQGFANVHFFQPPLLNTDEIYIDLQTNSTLEIVCSGKYPVLWKIQSIRGASINNSRLTMLSSVNASQTVYKYKTEITLTDLDYKDTGYYSCYYEDTTDFNSAQNVTSLYVFVNDPVHLFVETSAIISGHLLIPLQQGRKGIIPCLPTSSKINVTLWKTEDEDDYDEMITLGTDITFDPMHGFHLYYPTFYFSGSFQCRAYLGNVYQDINVTLLHLPVTYHDPQPFIDKSQALHPIINSTFILKCTVSVDPGTRLFIDWSYPNKNSSSPRINETKAISEWKTVRSYQHQEVTTYLVVKEAQSSDSGKYICSVTDHSQKTGVAEVDIFVYSSLQPVHVNFTTDIDISEPVVYPAGNDVKFVITVNAFPSMSEVELYWERNSKTLFSDGHYHLKYLDSGVMLEITDLARSDAATYTLYGKTKDSINSISILLEVKDKPIVFLKNTKPIYMVGEQYSLECHADGYPAPIVWWRWKSCYEHVHECSTGGSYGWTDVEPRGSFPNEDNVTLEYSNVKNFSLVSYLHVTANHSGYYICVASNDMGKDDSIAPFIVTDAINGFEITISKRKPVDEDYVELICKVNTYNYSHVEWGWRPMHSEEKLILLKNISDVTVYRNSSQYSHSEIVIFNPITLSMSGEYECIASNFKRNLSDTEHITIDVKAIKKPVLNRTNMLGLSTFTAPGTLQEFYCYADGVPFPMVVWKKDGKIFDVTNMSGVEITEGNQKLTLKRVLERDAGFYQCVVRNRGGTIIANSTLEILGDNKEPLQHYLTVGETVAVVVFGIVGVIFFTVVSCLIKRIMKEKKQKKELDFMNHTIFERGYIDIFNPNLPLEDQIDLLPYKDSWEFPKERLKLGKTLGQGAFGRVVKAEAIGLIDGEASTTVAVKMLKEAADSEQRKALIAELKILIHIGRHLNIVNLLGAVTKNVGKGELYVIVEYCCFGNLRHFLLKHKGSYIDQLDHQSGQLNPNISTLPGSPFLNMEDNMVIYSNILGIGMDNPTYREQSLNYADIDHQQLTNDSGTGVSVLTSPSGSSINSRYFRNSLPLSPIGCGSECCNEETAKNHFITTCDLLCFAFQCARGMEYLASRKLIHRDLAARNVLLAKDNVVKICDFGLAKDCYKYSNYIKKSDGLLPIKWMAIESIRDRVFTSKSDVWSFGILLWEIFTLGSNPYPSFDINEEFFKKLKNGYRMEKPDLAPIKIYQLMKNCWLDDPLLRPDFSYLAENIGNLLETSVRKYYVELNDQYQVLNDEMLNNNDYLQMTGLAEDYTNMVDSPNKESLENVAPLNTYDNITSVRPVGNGPIPKVPMEVVPMIQLESMSETWKQNDSEKCIKPRRLLSVVSSEDDIQNLTETTYLNMASSPEKNDLDEYDSVFLDRKIPHSVHHINGDCSSFVPLLKKELSSSA